MAKVPSVGRIVHRVPHPRDYGSSPEGQHQPAVVLSVGFDTSDGEAAIYLLVHGFDQDFRCFCTFDAEAKGPGTWHWPEYVPDLPDSEAKGG